MSESHIKCEHTLSSDEESSQQIFAEPIPN